MIIKKRDINHYFVDKYNNVFHFEQWDGDNKLLPVDMRVVKVSKEGKKRRMDRGSLYGFTIYGEWMEYGEIDKDKKLIKKITKENDPEYFL